MSKNFAILRVKPIGSRADLVMACKHGRREDRSPHVDRSRSHHNRFWIPAELGITDPTDMVAAVDALAEKLSAKFHRGAAVAANFHVGASGEYFMEEGHTSWNQEKIKAWYRLTVSAFKERYPGQIAQVRLDLDEQTPHMAIIVLPIYIKKTRRTEQVRVSYRKVFGGHRDTASARMVELQDWYADAMSPLGLVRGEPSAQTAPKHQPHQVFRRTEAKKARQTQLELENAAARRQQAEALLASAATENEEALSLKQAAMVEKELAGDERTQNETHWQKVLVGADRIVQLLLQRSIVITSENRLSLPQSDWETVRPAAKLMAPVVRHVTDLLRGLDEERERVASSREGIERLDRELSDRTARLDELIAELEEMRDAMSQEDHRRLDKVVQQLRPF